MSRVGNAIMLWFAFVMVGATAFAQPAGSAPDSDIQIEGYLERLGLKSLLAEQLGARIKATSGEERSRLAERLGKLYIELIGSAPTAAEREQWEEKARELIRLVPDGQTSELRIEFARQSYLRAEETAERFRLRLADEAARADAEKALKALKQQFEQMGTDLNRREEGLARGEGRIPEKLDEQLAEARRLRAMAFYYAGWSGYYLALLTGQEGYAVDAVKSFGWLLGRGGGNPAALDRVPKGLFRYEHICRAAIGVAMCQSLRGQDIEAMAWLVRIEEDADTPVTIRAQLLPRKIVVLGAARRWNELMREVRAARGADTAASPKQTLEPPAARLLAVVSFEADASSGGPLVEQLRAIAMADLVARAEVANVLDLAQRYGTEPLGEKGFIVHYVRGVQAYERTSGQHKSSGAEAEEPVADASLANAYMECARLLVAASEQEDAQRFAGERTRSVILAGRAFFFAGDLETAATHFQRASALAASANDAKQAQEALWLAVVALDRLSIRTGAHPNRADEKLDELSTLFIRSYPATERAANLLLRRSTQGRIKDDEAVRVLLGVGRESDVYEASRRQAARLLYRLYRSAPADEKSFAAQRFVAVGEEVLAMDRRRAMDPKDPDAKPAIERVIVGGRQLLDAILGVSAPDLARAEGIMEVIQTVAGYNNFNLAAYADEINFRRFQILIARDEVAEACKIADALLAKAGEKETARFAISAQRILYNRAVQRYRKAFLTSTSDTAAYLAATRDVVRFGIAVIDQMHASPASFNDPAVATLYNTVAQAASVLFKQEGDREALLAAVRLDAVLVKGVPGHVEGLTRLGELSEAAGDQITALECWRTLSVGLEAGMPDWFRARYEAIRLLAVADPQTASEAIRQHIVLYPLYGPAPWGEKLRSLEQSLPPPAPSSPAAPPKGSSDSGSPTTPPATAPSRTP